MLPKLKTLLERFKLLPKWKQALIIITSGSVLTYLILILSGGATIISTPLLKTGSEDNGIRIVPNPLNGVLYTKTQASVWQSRLPLAVMIENLSEVRPQSGLGRADLVYEALTEGGITRFMAIYLAEETDEIGPVRSARTHFLDWVKELNALYAHIGGSPEALDRIAVEDFRTLPEELPYYSRKGSSNLSREHTAFSSTRGLWEMAKNRDFNGPPNLRSWRFKNEESEASTRPASANIKLSFTALDDYNVRWDYNPEDNSYIRFSGSPYAEDTDRVTNEPISTKNVVIQYTLHQELNDDKDRINITTTGNGEARIFLDGKAASARWEKASPSARTIYYDSNNNEIEFNRGKIWVEIIPTNAAVEYTE
ncbi:MAG: hypothetical protein A2802_00020 [Candidatus Woykebacteria bacterium RIFCSPHIGHO2_01_FULL_43_29]|uniref:DUF3048 domain-containing protein n=2 Tax=Candidatus Woykeibacteriota TaxID=1817899 RepID=A0A1G1WWM3_9BACT|nr:MAG: hypothetical protein A2802_00020 [Candidatus Woykebacteria bacterium RIFCSPHIGHO2_01_FULL_43_29]OGY30266.1 MAG: hypothetical protein A3J50_04355 [Candidatus Woykebacteria bacterium RIFCSPHIGHO2_02_FULL_43_16b]OGY32105.1 MAG: hypothetical protein A3A61_00295 [Candidatus Woykebacteria bacterium RIFCSPLOWO2_01_FULL_43_14]